jgi:hypothetical protein
MNSNGRGTCAPLNRQHDRGARPILQQDRDNSRELQKTWSWSRGKVQSATYGARAWDAPGQDVALDQGQAKQPRNVLKS